MNDWLTASAILLSGLVVGFMFVYSMKRSARTGEAERRDLQAKLDARVQQLRELEDVGGSDEERARLEREAADALRELEGDNPLPASVAAAASAAVTAGACCIGAAPAGCPPVSPSFAPRCFAELVTKKMSAAIAATEPAPQRKPARGPVGFF